MGPCQFCGEPARFSSDFGGAWVCQSCIEAMKADADRQLRAAGEEFIVGMGEIVEDNDG